ncbi:hypothetical protein RRG08_062038 [Elysia crispata]|uniref:Uncharacterized protein n=1 Tax=Elysia crispata TaxID=231223 RepID=A0AAE1A516_9GAST|nr:hypothetical protein RRG08_062038 [Elysia crispata]
MSASLRVDRKQSVSHFRDQQSTHETRQGRLLNRDREVTLTLMCDGSRLAPRPYCFPSAKMAARLIGRQGLHSGPLGRLRKFDWITTPSTTTIFDTLPLEIHHGTTSELHRTAGEKDLPVLRSRNPRQPSLDNSVVRTPQLSEHLPDPRASCLPPGHRQARPQTAH